MEKIKLRVYWIIVFHKEITHMFLREIVAWRDKKCSAFASDFMCHCWLTFLCSKLIITNIIHSLKYSYCSHVVPHDFLFDQMLVLCLSDINLILVVLHTKAQQCHTTYIGYLADLSDCIKRVQIVCKYLRIKFGCAKDMKHIMYTIKELCLKFYCFQNLCLHDERKMAASSYVIVIG